jgi:predicted RNA-binding Zn ribbon-like protein
MDLTGRLCLDYANTADWHASEHPEEFLNSYADLVAWGRHVGILTDSQAKRLLRKATLRPSEAAEVLKRAVDLREAIFRIFAAIAHGSPPKAADLSLLNQALSGALAQARVTPAADGFAWDWSDDDDALDRPLWPVVRSAAELLTSPELRRVGECADANCGWLFLDTSRNHSRKWCDINDCGNRAKARRYYERKRSSAQAD